MTRYPIARLLRVVNYRRNCTVATLNDVLFDYQVAFPNGGPSDPRGRVVRLGMARFKSTERDS